MKFEEFNVMPFGSYKGKTFETIYKIEPDYLVWARDNLKPPLSDRISDFLKEKNREIIGKSRPTLRG